MEKEKTFKITDREREHVAWCLRLIDDARKALEAKGPGNEGIVMELKKSADGIFGVMNRLPEIDSH